MSNANDRNDTRHADPDKAATDSRAAAQQEQVKEDHDALQGFARRVESSVPADVRETPIQHTDLNAGAGDTQNSNGADAARRNADIARDSARRVEDSVSDTETDTSNRR